MTLSRLIAFCALLLSIQIPAAAQNAAVDRSPLVDGRSQVDSSNVTDDDSEARRIASRRLADAVSPSEENEQRVIDEAIAILIKEVRAEPDVESAIVDNPDLLSKFESQLRQSFAVLEAEEGDSYEVGLAEIYARHLTTGEILGLVDFYASDTGKKMLATFHSSLSVANLPTDGPATADTMHDIQASTTGDVMDVLTQEDYEFLMRPEIADLLAKALRIRPLVMQYDAAYMNAPSPNFDAEIARILDEFYKAVDAGQ